uniref:inositol-3-phosphate synthase n=1 Tax=Corethron hystrix TaxID=216773 RepID=A0A7S1FWF0_9STRA
MSANWYGCITQIPPRGRHGGVGYRGRLPSLSDVSHAALGGWEVRPTPLGKALYEARILDHDLVRQVRDEMDGFTFMPGVFDPSFVGETQHAGATHVVSGEEASTWRRKVERIRTDIRNFKRDNGVDGHTTVIWSASVERPSEAEYDSPERMLHAIDTNENDDISPSIIYAIASALEGCSFVNGGSQNTLSAALSELFEADYRRSNLADDGNWNASTETAYLLGTDFKAGQTKFKTAAVEYVRALGLTPMVVASSNHLGNNDMLNLTSKATVKAKMRVKSNIFGPWDEDQLDHQVRVMYTSYIGDEKRDFVEYTSLGFLGCPHTMVTYTRCMDSILCVPLMIDAAVWCDYFCGKGADGGDAARATAYLFKVPEGGARGVDPGFHHQMGVLEKTLLKLEGGSDSSGALSFKVIRDSVVEGIITQEQANALIAKGSK